MFEVLYGAMQKDRVVFIDDAFFTFTIKEKIVTMTAFFSLNEAATRALIDKALEIAAGKPIKISLHESSPEIKVLAANGWTQVGSKNALQYWGNADASCYA